MNSFSLSDNPLNIGGFLKDFANDRAGARVSFEGVVRNHHLGQGVDFLEYEAFPEMVEAEGGRILTEARERFALTDAAAVHRAGRLEIGDVAVWVGALAEHRQEAFLACQWIMDQIKARLPVWKKEHFSNGTVEWVGAGLQEPGLTPRAEAYYQRQCVLPQLGPAGQEKLGRARVLVAGAGGLGCPALLYLAAAGAGQLSVIDGDTVNLSNLHRQILFTPADLGKGKASVAAERLRAQNPWIAVQAHDGFLDTDWLAQHLNGHDLVLDCTDHFPTRYLLHDACWRAGIPLVQAAIHQFEGQVQSFHPDSPGGCLRCLWPEPPSADCAGTCAEAGVLGLTAGQVGLQQAMEALRLLLDWPGHLLEHTLLIDLMSGATRRIRRQVRPGCVCRTGAFPAPAPMPAPAPAWLSPGDSLPSGARYVDIREAYERENAPADILALPHFPRERWEAIPGEIRQRPLILCCAAGVRTRHCLELLGHPPRHLGLDGVDSRPTGRERKPPAMSAPSDPSAKMFSGDPVPLIVRSYRHWTGENLLPSDLAESGWAEALAGLSRVVVAHDTAADPCFVYGNRAALELFEMRREDFIGMPSRLSAEPVRREERARVLEEVRVRGFSTSYSGVRVSATGKRFRIENAVLWNLVDHEGVIRGQAATFAQWSFL